MLVFMIASLKTKLYSFHPLIKKPSGSVRLVKLLLTFVSILSEPCCFYALSSASKIFHG